jgi:hypothetical protein
MWARGIVGEQQQHLVTESKRGTPGRSECYYNVNARSISGVIFKSLILHRRSPTSFRTAE